MYTVFCGFYIKQTPYGPFRRLYEVCFSIFRVLLFQEHKCPRRAYTRDFSIALSKVPILGGLPYIRTPTR